MRRGELRWIIWMRWFALFGLLVVGAGCASSANSVRALRQYEREPANLNAALDRIEDLDGCLLAVHTLLQQTPYSPGDVWVQQIAMGDSSAKKIEAELRQSHSVYKNGQIRVPVAKLYLYHVERTLASHKLADTKAKYPNILAALGALSGRGQEILDQWNSMGSALEQVGEFERRARILGDKRDKVNRQKQKAKFDAFTQQIHGLDQEIQRRKTKIETQQQAFVDALKGLAQNTNAQGAEVRQIVRDLMAVSSVIARLELEAVALAPVIGVQLLRAQRDIPKNSPELSLSTVVEVRNTSEKLIDMPAHLASITSQLRNQVGLLVSFAEVVSKLSNVALRDTPGYSYAESASSQVVGLALDSFYLKLDAGADALIFNQFANNEETTNQDGSLRFDLTGRQSLLRYNVEPIILATIDLDVGFDFFNIPNFLQFDFGYKTDRVYKSGGELMESTEVLGELGVSGLVSDVLSFGLALLGVNTRLRLATFTSGEVELVDVASNQVAERAPLQFSFTDIELSYDILWWFDWPKFRQFADTFLIGFRYFNYTLPRIVYEYEDQNGAPDVDDYTYVRESPPQPVASEYFMLGAKVERGVKGSSSARLLANAGLYVGGGPSSYYLTTPNNRESKAGFAFVADALVGWAFPFTSSTSSFQLDFRVVYEAQLILGGFVTTTVSDDPEAQNNDAGENATNFGGFDLFHGPHLRLSASF